MFCSSVIFCFKSSHQREPPTSECVSLIILKRFPRQTLCRPLTFSQLECSSSKNHRDDISSLTFTQSAVKTRVWRMYDLCSGFNHSSSEPMTAGTGGGELTKIAASRESKSVSVAPTFGPGTAALLSGIQLQSCNSLPLPAQRIPWNEMQKEHWEADKRLRCRYTLLEKTNVRFVDRGTPAESHSLLTCSS